MTASCVVSVEREEDKVIKHRYLAPEVKRLWQLRSPVKVILVLIGTLDTILKKLELYLEKDGIEVSEGLLQKVPRCLLIDLIYRITC